jgi:hypothetical protein
VARNAQAKGEPKSDPAPIESGAVETGQVTGDSAPTPINGAAAAPAPEPEPQPLPNEADLTGPEMAEIKVREAAVDRANREATDAQSDARQKALMAQYAQEALTGGITNLIRGKGLDPTYRYQIDLERGRIVNRGRLGPVQMTPRG